MGGIYLIQEGGDLIEMAETLYDSEALLQELLARYPSLLAGEQVDPIAPRRWLLISQEVPLAADESGAWRWTIDHVFLDQDGIPTLVEVKRSTDTRIRREVVGQMLDYAANAVMYWPVSAMQEVFERRCQSEGREPLDVFVESLQPEGSPDEAWESFWQQVQTNLQAGRIRMIFIADKIPPELLHIVEFLNGQMDPAQVLAIEVKQYLGQNQRALVPRVLGSVTSPRTARPSQRSPGRQWDEETFFASLEERNSPETVDSVHRIIRWTRDTGWNSSSWGEGRVNGTFNAGFEHLGQRYGPIQIWTNGFLQVNFGGVRPRQPFDQESLRREFWVALNQIDGVSIPEEGISGWPRLRVEALGTDTAMTQFLGALEWFTQVVRSS